MKRTAVIEMAEANGIELLAEKKRNPLLTSTYGTWRDDQRCLG